LQAGKPCWPRMAGLFLSGTHRINEAVNAGLDTVVSMLVRYPVIRVDVGRSRRDLTKAAANRCSNS
jgi:hypothetical protein